LTNTNSRIRLATAATPALCPFSFLGLLAVLAYCVEADSRESVFAAAGRALAYTPANDAFCVQFAIGRPAQRVCSGREPGEPTLARAERKVLPFERNGPSAGGN
jgi:hypothetical protein